MGPSRFPRLVIVCVHPTFTRRLHHEWTSSTVPSGDEGRTAPAGQPGVLKFRGNNSRRLQMRWSLSGKFAAMFALSGTIALLQTGCTTEPTSAHTAVIPHDGGPAFVNTLSVFGPDSITATGNYTYTAYWS